MRDVPGGGRIALVRVARLDADWRPYVQTLLLAALVGAVLAAGLGLLIARRLARPVRRLSAATRALAAGGRPAPVPVGGPAEVAELSASFNAMADDLDAAQRREHDFLQAVSHELKTPLTAVRGYAEAIADGAVDPTAAAAVIGVEAQRLERLVGDLLELGRLHRPGFSVRREPVDLAAVAADVVRRFEPRAAAAGVGLRAGSSADADETGAGPCGDASHVAVGDADRVLQAVANLVDNALRVTPAGGTVTVTAAPGRIAVRDTGPGLRADDAARAFERFHLHDRSGAPADGSGLGLALVAELATAMGGRAEVESAPGAGATFALHLPRAPVGNATPWAS